MSTPDDDQAESTRQCKVALEKFHKELAKSKNVVGLGIVPVAEKALQMAVAVYVKKLPGKDTKGEKPIPEFLEFIDDGLKQRVRVPTKIVEQGETFFEEAEAEAL